MYKRCAAPALEFQDSASCKERSHCEENTFSCQDGYQNVEMYLLSLTREFLEHHSGAWCSSVIPVLGLSPPGHGFIFSLHHFSQTVVLQLQSTLMRWVFGRLTKFLVPRVTCVLCCLLAYLCLYLRRHCKNCFKRLSPVEKILSKLLFLVTNLPSLIHLERGFLILILN